MSSINVNAISNEAGTGAPNFPNGLSVNSNPLPTAGSLSNRNRIINGNFDIWQRGTSGSSGYVADRWRTILSGSTAAISRQSFTLGQTDVPGEPDYYHRTVVTSSAGAGNFAITQQPIESVKTLAGQTATLSFWAKADASKNMAVTFNQIFGTGGSPSTSIFGIGATTIALTTSWQKFTVTANIPSISGKTLGTNNNDQLGLRFWFDAGSNFDSFTNTLGQQSGTFDIARVQLEAGDVATPFEYRPPAIEKSMCRYYYLRRTGDATNELGIPGYTFIALAQQNFIDRFEEMRVPPSFACSAATDFYIVTNAGTVPVSTSLTAAVTDKYGAFLITGESLAANLPASLHIDTGGTGWLAYDAEL